MKYESEHNFRHQRRGHVRRHWNQTQFRSIKRHCCWTPTSSIEIPFRIIWRRMRTGKEIHPRKIGPEACDGFLIASLKHLRNVANGRMGGLQADDFDTDEITDSWFRGKASRLWHWLRCLMNTKGVLRRQLAEQNRKPSKGGIKIRMLNVACYGRWEWAWLSRQQSFLLEFYSSVFPSTDSKTAWVETWEELLSKTNNAWTY